MLEFQSLILGLKQTLGNELAVNVYQACIKGEIDKVDRILAQAQQRATVKGAKEVYRLKGAI